jgi:hypothetical protein
MRAAVGERFRSVCFTFMKTTIDLGIIAALTLLMGCATQHRGAAYGHLPAPIVIRVADIVREFEFVKVHPQESQEDGQLKQGPTVIFFFKSMPQAEVARATEELRVLGVRGRPAALDEVDAEVVELLGDAQLVVDRCRHAFDLQTIAQRRVEHLDRSPGAGGFDDLIAHELPFGWK